MLDDLNRFKELDERTVFDAQLAQLLPKLQDIMVGLMAAPTPEHLLVQKMVLKIVYRAIEVWSLTIDTNRAHSLFVVSTAAIDTR
jgi:hypothetical protein